MKKIDEIFDLWNGKKKNIEKEISKKIVKKRQIRLYYVWINIGNEESTLNSIRYKEFDRQKTIIELSNMYNISNTTIEKYINLYSKYINFLINNNGEMVNDFLIKYYKKQIYIQNNKDKIINIVKDLIEVSGITN